MVKCGKNGDDKSKFGLGSLQTKRKFEISFIFFLLTLLRCTFLHTVPCPCRLPEAFSKWIAVNFQLCYLQRRISTFMNFVCHLED